MSDLISSLVEVRLKYDEDFLKVKETLTRIGIASKNNRQLFQSCHILHKQGRYYIVHFLEMFLLDGKGKHFSDEDRGRRNTIATLLAEWKLVEIVNPKQIEEPRSSMKTIKIVPFKDKLNWELIPKYDIGSKNTNR